MKGAVLSGVLIDLSRIPLHCVRTIARLGWTFSYIHCIFVHPDLDLALLLRMKGAVLSGVL